MKPYFTSIALGVAASATGSAILAYGSSLTAGAMNHHLEGWPWMFAVSVVPCAILPSIILRLRSKVSFRGEHFLCIFLLAFAAMALAGSAGAVVVESARRGIANVNVSGYLVWCWVYAIALLPVSFPLAALVLCFSEKRREP